MEIQRIRYAYRALKITALQTDPLDSESGQLVVFWVLYCFTQSLFRWDTNKDLLQRDQCCFYRYKNFMI